MKTPQAVALLSKLQLLRQDTIALTPEEWRGTGLVPKRKLVNAETREPIFVYVDKDELIEVIRKSHNLHRSGKDICRTLNFKTSLGDTQ